MIITFSLISAHVNSEVFVDGDTISIDGKEYDFCALKDGETTLQETQDWPFLGPVRRDKGQIKCVLIYRYDGQTADQKQPEVMDAQIQDITSGTPADPVRRSV